MSLSEHGNECISFANHLANHVDWNQNEHFQSAVNANLVSIVHNLGGVDKILQLCLTNRTYIENNITSQNLQQLKSLLSVSSRARLQSNNDTTNTHINCNIVVKTTTIGDNNNIDDETQTLAPKIIPIVDNDDKSISQMSSNVHNLNQMNAPNKNINIQMIDDPSNYFRYRTVLQISENNNLYFKKLFVNKKDFATYWFYNIIKNKWYTIATASVGCVFWIIAQLFATLDWSIGVYRIFLLLTYLIGSFYATSIICGSNIDVVWLIFGAFEFWYKIYNLCLVIVSYFLYYSISNETRFGDDNVKYFSNGFDIILDVFWVVVMFQVCFVCFTIDAYNVSNKIKISITLIISGICMYGAVSWFLWIKDDVSYNPLKSFDIAHSNINVKSLRVSSWFNLGLFTAKQLMTYLFRKYTHYRKKIVKFICGRSKNERQLAVKKNNNYNDVRASTLYRKPYLRFV